MRGSSLEARIGWLTDEQSEDLVLDQSRPEVIGEPRVLADGKGTSRFDLIHLSVGMTFVRSRTDLAPSPRGQMLFLGRVSVGAKVPLFQIYTLRGGRVLQQYEGTPSSYLYEDGFDLFTHTQQREVNVWAEGGCNLDMVSLAMDMATLDSILGFEDRIFLIQALGLETMPSSAVRGMPRNISSILRSGMSLTYTGASRRLYAQARGLEYLSKLLEHLRGVQPVGEPRFGLRKTVLRLRDELLHVEGKLPTLEALALKYEVSARRLNAEFTREFGESIFSFITGQRLEQARIALQETDIPMKILASRLGYSHVNHFITAFKNRFGQPPGAIRRRG